MSQLSHRINSQEGLIPLDGQSKYIRTLILRALRGGNLGHAGSALSLVEILRVLFENVLKFDSKNPNWPDRDRLILSKGHGCLALYAILAHFDFFPKSDLDRFCHHNSPLGGHPNHEKIKGVDFSTGSLGHGLSVAVGMALAAKIQKRSSKVFVIMGDGELGEGSVWEAALSAAHHKLNNLIALVDCNKYQAAGQTQQILNLEPLSEKWHAFGFDVFESNGHDISELKKVISQAVIESKKPKMIICHTVKGKGIPEVEQSRGSHFFYSFSPEQHKAFTEMLEKY